MKAEMDANGQSESVSEREPYPVPDQNAILHAIETLFEPGDVIELRVITPGRRGARSVFKGWDERAELVNAAVQANQSGGQCYVLMNRANPVVAENLSQGQNLRALGDSDIGRRRWILVDIDPERPSDTSSSLAEFEAAQELAKRIRAEMVAMGWPEPLMAVSGNGAHLLFPIDLPNDAETARLIRRVLARFSSRYTDANLKIDTTVSNAARITRLYGTVAKKGDPTDERPWRLSSLIGRRSDAVVTLQQLTEFAPQELYSAARTQVRGFDIGAFLDSYGIAYEYDTEKGYGRYKLLACVFNPDHGPTEAAILDFGDGRLVYKCFHDSCAEQRLRHVFERLLEPGELTVEHRRAMEFQEFQWLATLSSMDVDREIGPLAKVLGVRGSTLRDRLKDLKRTEDESLQGMAVELPDIEPWAEPVSGKDLLEGLVSNLNRFVVLPEYAAVAIALWIVHTFVFRRFDWSPKLGIVSPAKRCGKSVLLRCIANSVQRPLDSKSVTAAALMRVACAYRPTILMDEADAISKQDERMRVLLNGSSESDGGCIQCEGREYTVRRFPIFTPITYAMIGVPQSTVQDRTIQIPMTRKAPGSGVEKATKRAVKEAFSPLGHQAARWASDNEEALNLTPDVPPELNDRAEDIWTPLFSIADAVGGKWPELSRQAARALSTNVEESEQDVSIQLLDDIREVFEGRPDWGDFIGSTDLATALTQPGSPWAEYGRSREPISTVQLARILRAFGVKTKNSRLNGLVLKAYSRRELEERIRQYLPPKAATPLQADEPD